MAENTVLELSVAKGIPVDKFKQDDKFETIEVLYDSGFFLLKGAVPEIARILKISEPTVYRYLQNVKAKDQ
ncbi:helix-turn-helix domain-containing protein [Erysipelothrix sp. D19-032]